MKYITKYYSILLSIILFLITTIEYIDYNKYIQQNELSDLPLDVIFGEWIVVISYFIIAFLVLTSKKNQSKYYYASC